MTEVKLDQEFTALVKPVVMRVWNVIGMDLEASAQECGESLTNDSALESCLDCYLEIYGGANSDKVRTVLTAAIKIHGWDQTFKFLNQNIRLA